MKASRAFFLVALLSVSIVPVAMAEDSLSPPAAESQQQPANNQVSAVGLTCSGKCERRFLGGYVGPYVWKITGGNPDCCDYDRSGRREKCLSNGQRCEPSFSAFAGYTPCSCSTR